MFKLITIFLPIMLGFLGYKFTANRLAKKLKVNSLLMKDPNIAVLVKKIEHSLGIEEIKVYVLEDLNLNGVASPDGKVFITRGFLEKYYNGFFSAEELFGVITHELGHHALGHTKKRMVAYTVQNTLQMGLGFALSRVIPFVGNYLSMILLRIVSAKLSRMDEYAADEYAAALMLKIGLDITPLINLFSKLEKLNNNQNQTLTWLQSHPPPRDRISAIKKLEDRWTK